MIKISFNLSIRPKIRFLLITLMMFLSSFFLFSGLNIINITYINENPYLFIRHQTVSNFIILLSILLFFIDFTVIHSLKFENQLFYTILDVTSKRWKKIVIYNLTKLYPVILGTILGCSSSFGILYLVGTIEGSTPPFQYVIPNLVIPFVFPIVYSIITQTSFYLYIAVKIKRSFKAFPYILSILAVIFFIFALKSDVMAILFYFSLVILMSYFVVKISDYIRSISKSRYMDSNYGRLLFRTLLDKSIVPLFFITFVFTLIFQANISFRRSRLSDQEKYFQYDTELKIDVTETNMNTILEENGIVYTYLSAPLKASYNNKDFILYICDTSMIKEFTNVNVRNGVSESDTIILPSDYMKKYNMSIGGTYSFTINSKEYRLKVKDYIDSSNSFIAYASNITNLDVHCDNVLIKYTENDYNVDTLLQKLEGKNYVVSNGEKEHYVSLERGRYIYLIFIFITSLIIFIFWYAKNRIVYYNKKKDTLNELLVVPVRSFQIKRLIFLNNFEIFTIALLSFFAVHLMMIAFYNPGGTGIYYTAFKNLKITSLIIFILEIFSVYNIIFLLEYLIYSNKE